MNRHLLPEEIDQLLDGEVGFGTTPLKQHVRTCAECRAELDSARVLVSQLEQLPHFTLSPRFTDEVMQRVHVFVPWHVALADTVRAFIPQQRRWRTAAWAGVASVATVMLLASLWLITRLDAALFVVELGLERIRAAGAWALSNVVVALFGDTAAQALSSSGAAGLAVALLVAILTALLAVGALRMVVAGARHR
ncbi:MAG TPA: hypothetical protein VFT57_09145 [Gemmatimonadaceae bacterium]|nr:hypothetical protein [Gemmatimonadaceae bacterium]